jgi:hypothetical protein
MEDILREGALQGSHSAGLGGATIASLQMIEIARGRLGLGSSVSAGREGLGGTGERRG